MPAQTPKPSPTARVLEASKSFFLSLVSWLGAPALLAEKDQEIAYLKERIKELEAERLALQDRFLERVGARPLHEEPLPPAAQQAIPFEDWVKRDKLAEIEELRALAADDPETYLPLLQEAVESFESNLNA